MLRQRLRSRFLLAAIAVGQALSPGIASIADAKPEAFAYSRKVAPHVENFGAKHGWRLHLDNCALCQLATRLITAPNAAPLFLVDAWRAPRAPETRYVAPTSSYWAAPRSRAPPAV